MSYSSPSHISILTGAIKASAERLIDDYNGEKQATQLLRSIPKPIVEAIIDGTIGYRYKADPDFAQLFTKDGCPGVYLNTFLVKGTGKGLNSKQWKALQDIITRYLDGQKHIIDENSTKDQEANAEEAARIEYAYNRSNLSLDYFREMTREGKRAFTQPIREQDRRFCRLLSNRICFDIDPSGTTPQLQSPAQVGCSQNLGGRMPEYSPDCGMKNTPNLWALIIKCLAVLNIEIEHISLPILKVWRHDHLAIAETLITELASSMVEYGGINPIQPGNATLTVENDLFEVRLQAFVESARIADDMEASLVQAKLRIELLESIKDVERYGDDLEEMDERVSIVQERQEKMISAMRQMTKELEEDTEKLCEEDPAKSMATIKERKAQLAFRMKTLDWLQGIKDKRDMDDGISMDSIVLQPR
ncbi:uncharacterized protein BP5553_09131 [Venustampulla echinocandica]|uniref:Uncharacterized protein n=1 Tax=Venustampulla echinocandica TaxID=2656787 RepID=A0A370TDZ0_9HELO|nr:uncharacterized protein BP5553_09131 [Venustampulla echinocandica]RDL32675.1 hypothetical protein BP5553_09131 [Venustampulla echinocandica]